MFWSDFIKLLFLGLILFLTIGRLHASADGGYRAERGSHGDQSEPFAESPVGNR